MTDESRKAFSAALLELQKDGGFDLPYRVWAKCQAELATANAKIAELEAHIAVVERDLERATSSRKSAEAQLNREKVQRADLLGDLSTLSDERNSLHARLAAIDAEVGEPAYSEDTMQNTSEEEFLRISNDHHKHRVERLAAKNVRLVEVLTKLADERIACGSCVAIARTALAANKEPTT